MKTETKAALKKITAVLLFLLIAAGIYAAVLPVLENKNIEALSKDYRTFPKNTFDVLFVGSSAMKNAVYPLQLYDEYGIAAYNLGSGSQSLAVSYYLIKEAIREHHPELIVLDCINAQYADIYQSDENLHYVTDVMGFPEKLELVRDIVPAGSRLAFLFEMALYHDRIGMLTKEDFTYSDGIAYGAKVHYLSGPFDDSYTVTEETEKLPGISERYLRRIIEYCRETGTGILLTAMPLDYSRVISYGGDRTLWQKYYNYIRGIADEYQVPYLNFMHCIKETGISAETDYDPEGAHLNYYGAVKMTAFLGNYIKNSFSLPDVREDRRYDHMREDLQRFNTYTKLVKVRQEKDPDAYLEALLSLKDGDFTILAAASGPLGTLLTAEGIERLQSLGIRDAAVFSDGEYHSFAAMIDRGEPVYVNIGSGDAESSFEGTAAGQSVSLLSRTLQGGYITSIKIANREYSKNVTGLNFVVYDNETGTVADAVGFAADPQPVICIR